MTTKLKTGRPKNGEECETVRVIHVALDAVTDAALKRLEKELLAEQPMKRGKTSAAVRRAILEAINRK